jgi:hypothetical protein
VVGVLAVVFVSAVLLSRRPDHSTIVTLRAGPVVDVSSVRGAQSETALAVDPRRPAVAIAGSNDLGVRSMRVYATANGGRTWSSGHLPLPAVGDICATSDPGVAIGTDGAQYFSFLGVHCRGGLARGTSIYVARRPSAGERWRTLTLPVSSGHRLTLADDRPSITADLGSASSHRNRLYLAWSRFSFDPSSIWADPDEEDVSYVNVTALVSHSDDRGRSWSKPAVLTAQGTPLEVRVAVARDGEAYAVWRDSKTGSIYIARSTDGNAFEEPRFVASAVVPQGRSCHSFRTRIPAQPKRCVSPNPVVAVDTSVGPRGGTVYLVWGTTGLNGSQDVEVAAFAPDLKPRLGVGRVKLVNANEGLGGPDQFLPTATVDSTSGRLWVCYYQTLRAAGRTARFTCTASEDGGSSWAKPIAATRMVSDESRRPANVENGYGDYESIASARGAVLATWTDGSSLAAHQEEINAARITTKAIHR